MKTIYRIPTKEQYAYIEMEGNEDSFESAYAKYQEMIGVVKHEAGNGLDPKQFNRCLDEYVKSGELIDGAELYGSMSKEQQMVFQELKKCFARLNK